MKKWLVCSLMLLCNSLYAVNWQDIGASSQENKEKTYIDIHSIRAHNFAYDYHGNQGYYLTAWIKKQYPTAQKLSNGKLYRETKEFYYFDCIRQKMNFVEGYFYTSKGALVDSVKGFGSTYDSEPWNRIVPGSVGEVMLFSACLLYEAQKIKSQGASK